MLASNKIKAALTQTLRAKAHLRRASLARKKLRTRMMRIKSKRRANLCWSKIWSSLVSRRPARQTRRLIETKLRKRKILTHSSKLRLRELKLRLPTKKWKTYLKSKLQKLWVRCHWHQRAKRAILASRTYPKPSQKTLWFKERLTGFISSTQTALRYK